MMTLLKKIIRFIHGTGLPVIAFMMLSCETVIDADLPMHKPSITLNGIFHPDSTIQVTLIENKFILDNNHDFKTISDATVQLFAGDEMIGGLSEDRPGLYRINFYPEAGVEYRITAAKEGFETVEAQDKIPELKANASIKSMEEKTDDYGGRVYQLTYSIEDPVGEDYYETRLYKLLDIYDYYQDEDTSYHYATGQVWHEVSYNEVGAEFSEFEGYDPNYYFSDELFNGRKREVKIEFNDYRSYAPGEENSNDTLRLFLQVRKVSESYYRYRTTLELHQDIDGNIFAEPAPVYKNIKNGYGIFAGYNSKILECEIIPEED